MALALAHIAEGFVGKRAVVSRSFAINELTTRRFAGDESPHGDPSVAPTARAIEALISPEFSPSDWLCFQEPVPYRDPAVAPATRKRCRRGKRLMHGRNLHPCDGCGSRSAGAVL